MLRALYFPLFDPWACGEFELAFETFKTDKGLEKDIET